MGNGISILEACMKQALFLGGCIFTAGWSRCRMYGSAHISDCAQGRRNLFHHRQDVQQRLVPSRPEVIYMSKMLSDVAGREVRR